MITMIDTSLIRALGVQTRFKKYCSPNMFWKVKGYAIMPTSLRIILLITLNYP